MLRKTYRLTLEQLEDRRLPANYFVSTTGNDLNAGTMTQPFRSIQHALNVALNPGDTVQVRAGKYFERLSFPASGSAAGSILLRNFGTEKVVLSGANLSDGNLVEIADRSYVQLIGFDIANLGGVRDGSGIRITGSGSHIELRNNRIHDIRGTNAMGITVYGTGAAPISDLVIDGNEIYACKAAPSEALTLNGNVNGFQITNNLVRDNNNIGIDMIGGETDIHPTEVARNGLVRGNTVRNNRSNYGGGFAAGIYVDGGKDIVIENNISTGNDLGIEIGAENAGIVTSGIVVRNNLIYKNQKTGLVFGGFESDRGRVRECFFVSNTLWKNNQLKDGYAELEISFASNNVVAGNIFFAGSEGLLLYSEAGGAANQLDHNVWFGPSNVDFTWNGTAYDSFTAFQTGAGLEANGRFANPLFVNPKLGDFHLQAGSPALDTGSTNPAWFAPQDFDGRARPQGPLADAGAFELLVQF
jgi:hypothetical protein